MISIKKYFVKYSLISGFGLIIYLIFRLIALPENEEFLYFDKSSLFYCISSVILILIIWISADVHYAFFKGKFGRELFSKTKLTLFTASFFITISLIIFAGNYFIQVFLYHMLGCNWSISENERIWNNFFKSEFVGVIFLLGYLIVVFQNYKRESDLLQEKINKENILFRYEKLKTQLDSHFLFNSFSILNSLILKDQKTASIFLNKLSEIYRYVLDAAENDLVELSQELNFIEDYLYLLKIRHQESLIFRIDVPKDTYNKKLPILALQLLIENAVKHNLFSSEIPLQIRVAVCDEKLIVSNDLRPRTHSKTNAGMGLINITNRYKHLCDKEIEVEDSGNQFIVKIPLI